MTKLTLYIFIFIFHLALEVKTHAQHAVDHYVDERMTGDQKADDCRRNLVLSMTKEAKIGEYEALEELKYQTNVSREWVSFRKYFNPAIISSHMRIISKYCRGEENAKQFYPLATRELAKIRVYFLFAKKYGIFSKELCHAIEQSNIKGDDEKINSLLRNIKIPDNLYMDFWGYFFQYERPNFTFNKRQWSYSFRWHDTENKFDNAKFPMLIEIINELMKK